MLQSSFFPCSNRDTVFLKEDKWFDEFPSGMLQLFMGSCLFTVLLFQEGTVLSSLLT